VHKIIYALRGRGGGEDRGEEVGGRGLPTVIQFYCMVKLYGAFVW
jgi:hypothetical protein